MDHAGPAILAQYRIVNFRTVSITPTVGVSGVQGQPGTGVDRFYPAQILGTSLLTEGDLMMFGVRLDDTSTAQRYVLDLNTRYPFSRKFRVSPRLRLSQRNSKTIDQTQFTVKPSVRINYIPKRLFQLELEAGGEWTQTNNILDTEYVKGYFLIAGYRLDF
jgi:hypothetical protein